MVQLQFHFILIRSKYIVILASISYISLAILKVSLASLIFIQTKMYKLSLCLYLYNTKETLYINTNTYLYILYTYNYTNTKFPCSEFYFVFLFLALYKIQIIHIQCTNYVCIKRQRDLLHKYIFFNRFNCIQIQFLYKYIKLN